MRKEMVIIMAGIIIGFILFEIFLLVVLKDKKNKKELVILSIGIIVGIVLFEIIYNVFFK